MSQLALTNNNNKSRLIFGIMKIDVIIWIHDLGKNCNSYCYLRILAIDERCRIFLTAYLTEIMNFCNCRLCSCRCWQVGKITSMLSLVVACFFWEDTQRIVLLSELTQVLASSSLQESTGQSVSKYSSP
jgi:hypothetical protein